MIDNAVLVKKYTYDIKDNVVSQKDHFKKLLKKSEHYKLNDAKISLNRLIMSDKMCKLSPLVRIEISLRDSYGLVYDTVYKTICS